MGTNRRKKKDKMEQENKKLINGKSKNERESGIKYRMVTKDWRKEKNNEILQSGKEKFGKGEKENEEKCEVKNGRDVWKYWLGGDWLWKRVFRFFTPPSSHTTNLNLQS